MLRAICISGSLTLHALLLGALWRDADTRPSEALDLGRAQDIFVEPPGMAIEDVSGAGDNLQSIEAQQAVALKQELPPLASVAPVTQNSDISSDADPLIVDSVSASQTRETMALGPPAASALSDDAVETAAAGPAPDAAAVATDAPAVQGPALQLPDQLHDVLASDVSAIADPYPRASSPVMPEAIATNSSQPKLGPATPTPIPGQSLVAAPADAVREPKPAAAKLLATPDVTGLRVPSPDKALEAAKANDVLALRTERPAPVMPVEDDTRELIEVIAEPDELVISSEQSSGRERIGGDANTVALYLGKVNKNVQRAKVNPRSSAVGNVLMRFTIGTDGALLSREVAASSGIPFLDDAAVAALDRAAPFPPIPAEVSEEPMSLTQLFRFVVR